LVILISWREIFFTLFYCHSAVSNYLDLLNIAFEEIQINYCLQLKTDRSGHHCKNCNWTGPHKRTTDQLADLETAVVVVGIDGGSD
jgi:hypothetical protein